MANPEADGLIPYTLGRAYGEHPSGTVLRVDAERKKWLDENEYRSEVPTPKAAIPELLPPRLPPRRRPMLPETEKEV